MKKEIIKGYKVDNFILDDLFVFTKNHYSFLLNKNGCSIIVNDSLLKDIKNKNLDEDLRIKLLSHALGKLSNKDFINKKEDNNIYFIIDVTKNAITEAFTVEIHGKCSSVYAIFPFDYIFLGGILKLTCIVCIKMRTTYICLSNSIYKMVLGSRCKYF